MQSFRGQLEEERDSSKSLLGGRRHEGLKRMWVAVKKGLRARHSGTGTVVQAQWYGPLLQQVNFCKFEASLICPVSSRRDRISERP